VALEVREAKALAEAEAAKEKARAEAEASASEEKRAAHAHGIKLKECVDDGVRASTEIWQHFIANAGAILLGVAGQGPGKLGGVAQCARDMPSHGAEIALAAYAVSSAMIAIVARSSAAHRARSRVNSAAKDSARAKIADAVAASRARLRRMYHVERLTPAASHGCFAGRLGPIPCARRQRSERKRFFSRRSASVCFVRNIFAVLRKQF
jgi:hypothetical protein